MNTEQAQENKQVIPGPFYWALNEVADAWDEFRYQSLDGEVRWLGAPEAGVYHQLCRGADNTTRECRTYQSLLCKRLHITYPTLRKYLHNLEGARLISVAWGSFDPLTGASAAATFTLLDIEEALRHGRRLSGASVDEAATVGEPEEASETESSAAERVKDSCTPLKNIFTPLKKFNSPLKESFSPPINSFTDKDSLRLSKTEKTVCGARDNTDRSPSLDSLPDAVPGDQRPPRFPRTAELAAWCRDALGCAVFPAETAPLELEPYEQALARLEGVARRCGQTAVEVMTTRLSLRPEVREQLRTARWPESVFGHQINYALEDFTARAARLGDAAAPRLPEPAARLPASGPKHGKPAWMSDEQWIFYETEAREGLCL